MNEYFEAADGRLADARYYEDEGIPSKATVAREEASVLATLALAEEVRRANEIALGVN